MCINSVSIKFDFYDFWLIWKILLWFCSRAATMSEMHEIDGTDNRNKIFLSIKFNTIKFKKDRTINDLSFLIQIGGLDSSFKSCFWNNIPISFKGN